MCILVTAWCRPAGVLYGTVAQGSLSQQQLQRGAHRASFRVINLLGSWQIRSEQVDGLAVLPLLCLSEYKMRNGLLYSRN